MPTTYEVRPAIGVARVGTSKEFFVGPEPGLAAPTTYRDRTGALLRQAARFRVFACDRAADGTLRSAIEVDPKAARIDWTVHVANRKGAGPEFPPRASRPAGPARLRNPGVGDRATLVVDPGSRTLSGPGQVASFDGGTFLGAAVPLGEMRTDADGRLVVVGGFGTSGSVSADGKAVPIRHFANNDRWHDDMSDGSVRATLTLHDGLTAVASPAWVVTAPPDFAPGVTNFVTLYDVAFEAAVERGLRRVPDPPTFARHVRPILERAIGYQWVLELGREGHGPGAAGDFTLQWAVLADPAGDQGVRAQVFGMLKNPDGLASPPEFGAMPRLHDSNLLEQVLRPTRTQYAVLERWAEGHFVNDLDQPAPVDELLPDALDRVALEACSGGPFFPGIEAGHILADGRRYTAAFRLDADALIPGQITEGNAVPWQADFLACTVDAQSQLGWWPAQRPYQVLTDVGSDETQFWARSVTGYRGMVKQWHQLGILVPMVRADGSRAFVESERRLPG